MKEEKEMSGGCAGCGDSHEGKTCEMEGCDAPGTECMGDKCLCADCAGKVNEESTDEM